MHPAAFDWVKQCTERLAPRKSVIEIGGRNINGSVRDLFVDAHSYTCIDLVSGPGVDVVIDACKYVPDELVDTVVCCEVLEHTVQWMSLLKAAKKFLVDDGVLILTCATGQRAPHSAVDGGALRPQEWYTNVLPMDLATGLDQAGFVVYELDLLEREGDLRALAYTKDPSRSD